MADIAGAKQAIKDRLAANWTTTRIGEHNETPDNPWPPVDANSMPAPFVFIEVLSNDTDLIGVGQNAAGANMGIDYGHIKIHVLVPVGTGTGLAEQYAATIADIYRQKEFYNSTPGFAVRTWRPRVDDGVPAEIEGVQDGDYWRTTMTAEFEFIYIK